MRDLSIEEDVYKRQSAACVAENFVELPISLATRVRLSISSVLLPMVAAT